MKKSKVIVAALISTKHSCKINTANNITENNSQMFVYIKKLTKTKP